MGIPKNNGEGENVLFVKISDELKIIKEKLDSQDKRLSELEIRAETKQHILESQPTEIEKSEFTQKTAVPFPAPPPPPPPPAANEDKIFAPPSKSDNEVLEEKIGGKIFARVGIVAIILGVSFFLKYAFDNNWIGETGRVILGIIVGLSLLVLGEKTIRKYSVYGQLISGGGIAILYLSIFAAYNFYSLIPQLPAFISMIFITVIGVLLSIRYDSIPLISWAIIGGFASPFLLSSGKNQQFELLSYILLLDLAVLAVSYYKKWRMLNILAYAGTILVFISWAASYYTDQQLASTMLFMTLFFLTYSLSSLIYNLVWHEKSTGTEQALTILAAISYFGFSYILLQKDFHDLLGIFTCLLGLYYLIGAYVVRLFSSEDENLYSFLAFLTIGFVTLAIPIQFEKNIITMGWTLEAIAIFYLGLKTNREMFKQAGLAIYSLALLRLFFVDSLMNTEGQGFLLNERFYTFLFAIISSYAAAFLLSRFFTAENAAKHSKSKEIITMLIIAANALSIFSVSQEIITSYGQKIKDMQKKQYEIIQEETIYRKQRYQNPNSYAPQGESAILYSEELKRVRNMRDISLSLFWLAYAIVIIVIGFARKNKIARVGGLVLLMLSILKLFFYDLWSLGSLYRIISSITLGIVLLSISFAYQKYKDKIKEIITE